MNNEKFIVEQQISNAPWDNNIERHVQIVFPQPNALDETLVLIYFIRYMENGQNVSHRYSQIFPAWIVSNNDRMMRRTLPEFEPIPNPEYDAESEFPQEQFITERAFYYLKELSELVPFPVLLRKYIIDENADPNGRFSK